VRKRVQDGNVSTANAPIRKEALGTDIAMARSTEIEEPMVGDEFAARIGPLTAPVLDNDKMSKLVALMGSEWVAKSLRKFALDVERGLASLDSATPSELAVISHGMIMMAASCGFTELLNVAEVVQREARGGSGLNRLTELRDAGDRALAVIRSYLSRS
jgi:hypothetical protein